MLADNTLGPQFNLDDPDWHYIYVCTKVIQASGLANLLQIAACEILILLTINLGLQEPEDMAPKPPPKKKK